MTRSLPNWRQFIACGTLLAGGCQDYTLKHVVHWNDVCETECDEMTRAVPLNLVVVTSDASAPTYSALPCTGTETSWPCVHVNALNATFQSASGPICTDPTVPETCVRFEYGASADYTNASGTAVTECSDFLDYVDQEDTAVDFATWSDNLAAQLRACAEAGDATIYNPRIANIYLFDNPYTSPPDDQGDTSFNVGFTIWDRTGDGVVDGADDYQMGPRECYPINFIDLDRIDSSQTDPALAFIDAADNHEMGHGYGLTHTCDPDGPEEAGGTNIMQTNNGNCCCEVTADGGHPAGWTCFDCSANNTDPVYGPDIPSTCDDDPGPYNDPDCADSTLSVGTRDVPFSTAIPSDWDDPTGLDQVERILENAKDMCECDCQNGLDQQDTRQAVLNEPACHGGSGRFALFPTTWVDSDDDGTGLAYLAPVMIAGDHLGRTSWIISVSVVGLGDATRLLAPVKGEWFHASSSDPDTFATAGTEVFSSSRTSATMSQQHLATAYAWATDGLSTSANVFHYPIVDLTWACSADSGAPDVDWHNRPPGAYVLPSSAIAGSWGQQILVRPDYARGHVWAESRGNPGIASVGTLTGPSNTQYSFSISDAGVTASGWLKPAGTPTGSKLRIHFTSISYGSWSRTNFDPADLSRLP